MTSLLWVDDNIDQFAPFVQKFREHGLQISTAQSNQEGFAVLDESRFDIVFWDFVMGHEPCANLLDAIVEKACSARVFIVSGFLYLHEVIDELARRISAHSLRIATLDKTTLPFTDDDEGIREFLADLMNDSYFETPPLNRDVGLLVEKAMHHSETMLWSDYAELDVSGKMAALDRVAELTRDIRRKLEEEGYVYMLFCGNYSDPLHKYKSLDMLPTEEKILDIARSLDRAPFEFTVSGMVDDISMNCCERSGLKGYPVLKIGFKGEAEEIHFDTGNPLTLVSFEWYSEKGWIRPSFRIQHLTAGDMKFKGRHIEWKNVIVTDSSGVTESCDFSAFAACDWQRYRVAVKCGPDCANEHKRVSSSKLCKYRTGLLGRNLATHLRIKGKRLAIDCTDGAVTFLED
ncbi:response regulator [Rhabdochromatium marinum]|uniref:response regulator n=1 Tax=Rhabdochromatium marinum TaxID=48729 RepID=UPI001907AF80|nr:response regulator [Rhabdochromatium marinum]MBK1649616.1 hypothetical protein [Rhabdochromatium marinum]